MINIKHLLHSSWVEVVSLVTNMSFLHLFEITHNGKWVKTKIIAQIVCNTVILKNY